MENIFKFVPIKSFVHPYFWHKLAELKLDVDRLSDLPKTIYGFYTNCNNQDCIYEVDYTAFNQLPDLKSMWNFPCYGILHNKNTIEEFKECDKIALLQDEGARIWKSVISGEVLQNPSLLAQFVLLSYADLKKHNYYYWFAFPTLNQPILKSSQHGTPIADHFNQSELNQLNEFYFKISDQPSKSFFFIKKKANQFVIRHLKDEIDPEKKELNFKEQNLDDIYIAFSDPSCFENVGWPLRLFTAALLYYCPHLHSKSIQVIAIRVKNATIVEKSLFFRLEFPALESTQSNDELKWIGWEANDHGKFTPKIAAMADTMDPERLAKNSVNLNLKLMKWRLMPQLDLEKISTVRCLLLGAGTLGCSVARNLLGWGATNITFIDNGRVSYSNPVRQNLFLYEDALNKGQYKAETAAKRLKDICPGILSSGYNLHIPMPGHTIGDSMMAKTIDSLEQLKGLIQAHDVIFLLTDSRESRWLPTLLGASYNKIIINAALGFDSYLVMRHGSQKEIVEQTENAPKQIDGLKCINGHELGCYFCNDITAPGNSMKDRTLDQQCTVTRPGVSNIAASLAVELLISLLQHPQKNAAPAYIACRTNSNDVESGNGSIPEGILGILPHSIRGQLSAFEQILPATQRFTQCIACSEKVLDEYKTGGNDFLLKVFESAKYLEDLTGLTDLLNADQEIIEYGDSDFELSE